LFYLDNVYKKEKKELLEGKVKPDLLHTYSSKISWSLLHPGHGREAESTRNIRLEERRLPTRTELAVGNDQEITNCNKKSAYITNSDEIELEFEFLSRIYAGKQFYMGKDVIRQELEGFWTNSVRNTKIPKYYRWVIVSGVYSRLEVEKSARKTRLRKEESKKETTKEKFRLDGVSSLDGGLITLFILCGGVMLLACTAFCLECNSIIWRFFKRNWLKLGIAFRKHKSTISTRFQLRRQKVHVDALKKQGCKQSKVIVFV
jgi:hypothetical protein